MFGSKDLLLIWVARNSLMLISEKMGAPETIAIPGNVIANLEVLDKDALYLLVKEWVKQHPTLIAMEVVWIFAPEVVYERAFPEAQKEQWETLTTQFLDEVPFEDTVSAVYTDLDGQKVAAVGLDWYTALKRAFEIQGYMTIAEVPASRMGAAAKQGISKNLLAYVASRMGEIEKNRMVQEVEEKEEKKTAEKTDGGKKKPKSMLPILLSVFLVLLIVLLYVVLKMR